MTAPLRLRILIDRELCVGNAQCVGLAPDVFRHDENVQSTVIDPAGAPAPIIVKAASYCPTGAIRVENADTGAVLFPSSE
ncbi:MAG: ferredoxin [Gemmatimonadales bacterium]